MSWIRLVPRIASRAVFYLAAAVSLGLCVGAAYMWVRSHYVSDRWGYAAARQVAEGTRLDDYYAWSAKGAVLVQFSQTWNTRSPNSGWTFFHETDGMKERPYVSVVAAGVPEGGGSVGPVKWHWVERSRQHLWADFGGGRVYLADRQVERSAVVPYWTVAVVMLVLPALAGWPMGRRVWAWRRERRRLRMGLCARCGYDLRSGPEPDSPRVARCPECGTETKAAGVKRRELK